MRVRSFFHRGNPPHSSSQKPREKRRASLWAVASSVALGRAFTSRIRRFYERRYKARHKPSLSRFLFVFDMVLVSIVAILIGLILFQTFRSFAPASFDVRVTIPDVVSVAPTPVEVSVRAIDGRGIHRNVRAFWVLPAGVEIVSSIPKTDRDGSIYLGTVSEGWETKLHAVVRAFRPVGDRLEIGLRLEEGGILSRTVRIMTTEAVIQREGMKVEIPDAFLATRVVARGAIVPLQVSNQTNEAIPLVELRTAASSTIDFPRQTFGDLPAHTSRFVFIELGTLSGKPNLCWSLIGAAHEVGEGCWSPEVMEWPNMPQLPNVPLLIPGTTSTFSVTDGADSSVAVLVPETDPATRIFKLHTDAERLSVHAPISASSVHWLASPVRELQNGSRILGSGAIGTIAAPLSFHASVRYYSASGDQLGAGSHPPVAEQETRYWIFFTISPSQLSLSQLQIDASLAPGIFFTGLVAAPDGGTWSAVNRKLSWKLPIVPSEQPSVMIGAEISLTPPQNSAAPYEVLTRATVEARDQESGAILKSEIGRLTTEDVD